MIVVDTGIWVDHFRIASPRLAALLRDEVVRMHPFVLGELALGNIPMRGDIWNDLLRLQQMPVVNPVYVLDLIRTASLLGSGIGYVDAHLIASLRITEGGRLWTRDGSLLRVAARFGVAYDPA